MEYMKNIYFFYEDYIYIFLKISDCAIYTIDDISYLDTPHTSCYQTPIAVSLVFGQFVDVFY